MRLATSAVLIHQEVLRPHAAPPIATTTVAILALAAAILLLAGLWTPVAGTVVALVELRAAFSSAGDPWTPILLATLGVALTLLGPGTWSVDARLFGWKRIDIENRQK